MSLYFKPHICYCQVPPDRLAELARARFVKGIPTEKLMHRLKNERDRCYLAAIALLDVKLSDLPKLIPDNPDLLLHLSDCREHVMNFLKQEGVHIPVAV